jgi:membrane-associated protease RseP (regulator of RpoE activity)
MNPSLVKKMEIPLKLKEHRELSPPANIQTQILTADGAHIIDTIAGAHPRNIVDAYDHLLSARNGDPIAVTFTDGTSKTLTPHPTPLPDAVLAARAKLGLSVEQLTPMLAEKYQLNQNEGIFIDSVARDSVTGQIGIQAGDILVQLGRYPVSTLDDLAAALNHIPANGRVLVKIIRDDQPAAGLLTFGNPADESEQ